MNDQVNAGNLTIAAGQLKKEKSYWQQKLAGHLEKCFFPYDSRTGIDIEPVIETVAFKIDGHLFSMLMRLSNNFEPRLHMVLVAAVTAVLYRYSGSGDIIVGTPIYKQEQEGSFTNTVLALRNRMDHTVSFKQLLLTTKQVIMEAVENQAYPLELLPDELNIQSPNEDSGFPLFDTVVLLQNIQTLDYIRHIHVNMVFSFQKTDSSLDAEVRYNSALYKKSTIERIFSSLGQLLDNALRNVDSPISNLDILTTEQKHLILDEFNNTNFDNRFTGTIHELFQQQVNKTPHQTAVIDLQNDGNKNGLTYRQLNTRANQVSHLLRKNGLVPGSVAGIMMEPSSLQVTALLGILKAGGAYLPIDTGLPKERVLHMLDDSGAKMLISNTSALKDIPFTQLKNLQDGEKAKVKITAPRPHIKDFDRLPMPDRSLIDLNRYKDTIGMASVTDCISMQTTRGCPYQCLYCHKIWSKNHVFRSETNIYSEIEYYFKQGVRNFAVIDDCFNLNEKGSRRLFEMIINNRLDVQIFFPNGLRGDIMTADYIDLMVEAGTRGINLSLETASPRLQKLLKKHLDLDKFKQVLDYISQKHPNVILELATMHGFPGESEEEAMMTLDFIKSIRWLHFPYIHILKIFPNTEMEAFALEQGISREAIMASKDRAFHELPETLPFPKSFTRKYQANFLNEYFLSRQRLTHVLPHQMKVVNEIALARKYNAYLPVAIKNVEDIINFAQLENIVIPPEFKENIAGTVNIFHKEPLQKEKKSGAKRIMFLDLSQHFSSYAMLYNVVEQPLGAMYLMTYLTERFGDTINGRIYKSGNDFDNFDELRTLIMEYDPHVIGIRTLTFFKEFFHITVSMIRQWGIDVPIITGGPYAASDYDTILKDNNIDLVVLGEGEESMGQLVEEMFKIDFKLPTADVLENIKGIAYIPDKAVQKRSREIILLDRLAGALENLHPNDPVPIPQDNALAYVMYTSGSTGKPKGVMVEHRQVNNCLSWMQDKFCLKAGDSVINRTNLTFDPSVWEIFWPLAVGAGVRVVPAQYTRDAGYLISFMEEDTGAAIMYCPATLVNIMVYLLSTRKEKPRLKLPYLVIGAEPIAMDTVKQFYSYFDGKIVNTYGPTECTINNTYYDLSADDQRTVVPIGRPVHNNSIYILSGEMRLLPINVPGEICIAGKSVARGYINNKIKSDLLFIDNPFADGKMYKTGDIGRWLEDGTIEIMGRKDQQVKIRGHRIELGEIESALSRHQNIEKSIVVVKDNNELQEKVRECKVCGIWSNYPGITIDEDNVCGICENIHRYKKLLQEYFLTEDHLEKKIKEGNKHKSDGSYDCLLVYACERVATYALYKLKDMGLKVLTVTYDSGHYDQVSLDRITQLTNKIGVDHMFLRHQRSDEILKESLRSAKTMCKGCIHTSSSLAGQHAYKHGIKYVIGETLSRGQIVENKLHKFIEMGIDDVKEIEAEINMLQRNTAVIDKRIFDIINIDEIKNGSIYDKVEFIDFYRYCNVNNEDMIKYLDEKDPYWRDLDTSATYSTDCKICQVGNFNHLKEKGYHYTGSAKSWDQRLGLTSLEALKDDLKIDLTASQHSEFLQNLGYRGEDDMAADGKHLCAYFVADEGLSVSQLREFLAAEVPNYMVPTYFTRLDTIPLTKNGKIDRKALPNPEGIRPKLKESYVPPQTELEINIANIWAEVLKVDMAGTEDNFFDLGGNSLDIIMVGNKLKDSINKDIPAVTLFTYPTISTLANHLSDSVDSPASPLEGQRPEKRFKGQNRLKQNLQKRKNKSLPEAEKFE